MKRKFYTYCESQNWPEALAGKISLLGVAAPLSSRKPGSLLRVAPLLPIIFPHPNGSGTALRGTPLIGFACLATLLNAWEQLYFFNSKRTRTQHKQKEYKVSANNKILKDSDV